MLAATGKGFRFPDAATANKIAARFEARANSMEKRNKLIDDAIDALRRQFSQDGYSAAYAENEISSLRSLQVLNKSAADYARKYSNKIKSAANSKMSEEEEIGSSWGKIWDSVV